MPVALNYANGADGQDGGTGERCGHRPRGRVPSFYPAPGTSERPD
jgi:hypothetical protein